MMIWNTIADRYVTQHDARTPRDPETGIMENGGPRYYGPVSADKAVLFVHGFCGTPNNFGDLPERVGEAGWRVYVPLLPGHGTSPRDFEETTMKELEEAVLAELAMVREHHDQVVLLGHSMGGALAAITASETPPDGLILVAPYFSVTHQWYYILRPETWAGLLSPMLRWVYRAQSAQPVNRISARSEILSYNWIPTRGARTAIGLATKARSERVQSQLKMPILLLHSMKDTITDPQASVELFEAFPAEHKRAVWLDRSDHIVFWDFDRLEVEREVLAFLAEMDGSGIRIPYLKRDDRE